jgi:two-component system sensor histidine kinase/response regulator
MSHEIRTPMHGVLGSLEMLQDTPLSGQQQRHLETARTSAGLLLGVIDEILDFSRLEAGKLRIESIDFDLRRTVEDVTAMLATRAHAKKLELACYISPEVPEYLRGDPIRLRQVLVNLLGNAIKFTEQGEVLLSVSVAAAAPSAADPAALRFEVRDTGIGIGEAQQQRLFEPFMQADSSTSRRFGGSGLGLSIAKRLVELMHGAIGLTSREGEGSTFWFTLPLSLADAGQLRRRAADFAGTRVLVVDDNATNRVILHRYLTSWNGHSGSAANGEEALAKLQDAAAGGRPYEVALLDLNMPGMDGYSLVRHIRRDPLLAGLPLIMLSSSTMDSERMGDLGVDIWLDKPVRQSDLYDALATVLHRQGAPTPLAAPMPASGPGSGQGLRFDGERVLLVEDNPITQDVGAQMLRQRGLQVQVAADGQQALDILDQEAVDLVLMDVQMPGMDGLTATRALRERERTRSIGALPRRVPVVALTAHALPADRERCLAAGMDDYVVKPYSSETLASVVARWLMPPRKIPAAAVPVPVPVQVPLPKEPASLPPADATSPPRVEIPSGEAIDLKRFAEVRQLMGESTGELIDRVVEALAAEMQACLQARAAADRLTLGDRMHRLKNTAGDIGAQEVYARDWGCRCPTA